MSRTDHLHVAIVGGGITGLASAYYLQETVGQQNRNISYTLLEQSERWGGKIRTDIVTAEEIGEADSPFIVEGGPDSFISQKPWAFKLARELGMGERFLPTNDDRRQTFVLSNGRPTPLPDGVLMIVPTKFMPFALSSLISPLGKLRMGMDLFIRPKTDGKDETLADFITRRLGSEALDKIAEPLMSGIYNAEAEKQSLLATFPRFRAIEEQHGSLIKGMLASRRARSEQPQPSPNGQRPPSIFVSFQKGMAELVAVLAERLTGDCRLNVGVEKLEAGETGYLLTLTDGSQLEADAVILAVPAYVAARLVQGVAPAAARTLRQIRYVSTGTISLAYRAEEIDHPLNGFGVVIPRSEERPINAITWTSTKFDQRAPEAAVLLRVFFGGSRNPQMMDVGDEELETIVRAELKALMGIQAKPLFHRIYRWFNANPQYDVGHLERVETIENALPPNLYVTGSPYRGIGIPDCIHQAEQTVTALLRKVADQQAV